MRVATDLGPVRARIKALLEEVTGIKRALAYTPRQVVAGNCPQWLIAPAEAEYLLDFWDGSWASYRAVRRWRLILLTGQAAAGRYGDLEGAQQPFFERLEDKLADNLKLDSLAGVVNTYLEMDSGATVLVYPPESEQRWFGCEWALGVETRQDIEIPSSLASAGSTVRGRLAAALGTVEGVTRVFEFSPKGIEGAHMPAFLLYEGEAAHGAPFADGHSPERLWRLLLLGGRAGAGIYGDVERVLDPFFEEVPKTLAAYLTLNDLTGVVNAVLVSDTGPGRVEFPPGSGDEWVGCEWGLGVQEKRGVTVGV